MRFRFELAPSACAVYACFPHASYTSLPGVRQHYEGDPMGADKSFLNSEGMYYGSDDQDPISKAHLRERAATVMPVMKKPLPKPGPKA